MIITDSYLQPEIRDDFFIRRMIKRYWAAQQKVLLALMGYYSDSHKGIYRAECVEEVTYRKFEQI